MGKISRTQIKYFLMAFDSLMIVISVILSNILVFGFGNSMSPSEWIYLAIVILFHLIVGRYLGLFSKINRYISVKEIAQIEISIFMGNLVASSVVYAFTSTINLRFFVLVFLTSNFLIGSSRILWRIYSESKTHPAITSQESRNRILVVGAGEGGALFISRMLEQRPDIDISGIIDDDPYKQDTYMYGKPVLGTISDIPRLVKENRIDRVVVAAPSMSPEKYSEILTLATESGVSVKKMPYVEGILLGDKEVTSYRDVEITDLLGRTEVELDISKIQAEITNQTILITGAGGSIGSEIVRQLAKFGPKEILLLGHGENSIYLIHREMVDGGLSGTDFIPIIADIKDEKRINEIIEAYEPDYIFHAAAHKHVPLMEDNSAEAIKNNVYGTYNVAKAAQKYGVKKFVMVSTDKANNPTNVMGATKRIAEMLVAGLNETGNTVFSTVRFGNVLGSRGSVIPLFKKQIKEGGPITITDHRMTRYFMTIPEASKLVIQAGVLAEDGELFVLDMGKPVKILDLARNLIKLSGFKESEIGIKEVGIRPGEKLYEELILEDEVTDKKLYDKIMIGQVNNKPIDQIFSFIESLDLSDGNNDELGEDVIDFVHRDFIS